MASGRWLDAYREKRELTSCPSRIGSYFTEEKVGGMEMSVIRAGTCSVPSGKMIVRDPMSYLGDPRERPYLEECPKGEFMAEIAAVSGPDGKDMYAACRVLFSEEPAVSFYEALVGYEDIYRMAPGEYFGFETESGLACICDEEAHQAFCEWMDAMFEDDPDFELYSDVLEQAFMDSRDAHPEHQGPSGDWIRWTVPGTELSAIIVQAGNGAGAYPVYWGYDARGNICQIAAQFLDLESGDERSRSRRLLSQRGAPSSEGARLSVSVPVPVHGNEASRPDIRIDRSRLLANAESGIFIPRCL